MQSKKQTEFKVKWQLDTEKNVKVIRILWNTTF